MRKFPPTETLSMFLAQAMNEDRSCQKAVDEAAIKRAIGGLTPCSTATGAYCQAQQRLPLEMVSTLACHVGELMNGQVPDQWRWHGRRVHLIVNIDTHCILPLFFCITKLLTGTDIHLPQAVLILAAK